jgi:DNA-binding MarR family transcriptional regulator
VSGGACQGLLARAAGQTTIVIPVRDLAAAVLRALRQAVVHEPGRALTVAELTDALGVDRSVLDAGLAELDDAGLIRVRGHVSTQRSPVQLTDAGLHALDGTA